MAKTRKNNRQLKSMEELKCTNRNFKLFFTVLVVIPLLLLFLSRMNTFGAAQSENICIDSTSQFDTNQQKDTEPTESAETSIPEANNIVETENQVKTEESAKTEEFAQTTESIEAIQNVESADCVEESVDVDSASENISLEEQVYENFIIPVTEEEIGFLVRAVQHEVGAWASFYPDADLDYVQQCMARVIINHVIEGSSGNTVSDVLFYPGHFMTKDELLKTRIEQGQEIEVFDPYEKTTRRNVLTVLRGEDSISSNITIEMSFTCSFDDAIEVMESQVGPVIPYFWTITAEGRLLIFAERDEERWAEMIAEANKKD